MNKQDHRIHIIGAGISGLIAATVLERNGYHPVIIEATNGIGGRVKTDIVNGYQLDRGFQVLLTAYPAAQKYLDLNSLELQNFLPGASIFNNGKQQIIGDPLRDISLLFSTLFSGIGTVSDKIKILKLNTRLKKKSLTDIFAEKEQSTLSYLSNLGFSLEILETFFTPFFSGIFLETKLETSSRMFEFVYKMFGEGFAALPKAGIGAIPEQLKQNLKHTQITFDSKVVNIKEDKLHLSNGETIKSDFIIVATDACGLIDNVKIDATSWKSCDTLYFETEKRCIKKPLIGLVPKPQTLINNIFYHTSLETNTNSEKELLSVTVVDNQNLSKDVLIERVQRELKAQCGITTNTLIKHYSIPMSLPNLKDITYAMSPSETQRTSNIFLAGDLQLNGSLNAAMISGERAAMGVMEMLLENTQ